MQEGLGKDPLVIALELKKSSRVKRFWIKESMRLNLRILQSNQNLNRKAKQHQTSSWLPIAAILSLKSLNLSTSHLSLVSRKIKIRTKRNKFMPFHPRLKLCCSLMKLNKDTIESNQIAKEIFFSNSWKKLSIITAILRRTRQISEKYLSSILLMNSSWTSKEKEG